MSCWHTSTMEINAQVRWCKTCGAIWIPHEWTEPLSCPRYEAAFKRLMRLSESLFQTSLAQILIEIDPNGVNASLFGKSAVPKIGGGRRDTPLEAMAHLESLVRDKIAEEISQHEAAIEKLREQLA